jgi:hypothetical protein
MIGGIGAIRANTVYRRRQQLSRFVNILTVINIIGRLIGMHVILMRGIRVGYRPIVGGIILVGMIHGVGLELVFSPVRWSMKS